MNQRGVDALLAAEAAGVRQCKGVLHDDKGGRCAFGVLFESMLTEMGGTVRLGDQGSMYSSQCPALFTEAIKFYGLAPAEPGRIVTDNNVTCLTFRQIAEKYGPKVTQPVPELVA